MEKQPAPGFFGKLPGLGDFVSRRLPRDFVDRWDEWLQQSIAISREQLGDAWLETYLVSPIWRFVLSNRVCNATSWAGILMPSVDRVGRYFPLTIAVPLPEDCNPFVVATDLGEWFEDAEDIALSVLDKDNIDVDGFSEQIVSLGAIHLEVSESPVPFDATEASNAWHIPLSSSDGLNAAYNEIINSLIGIRFDAYSLWWTAGSDCVAPGLLVCRGLPPAESYTALLSGDWAGHGWLSWPMAELPQAAPQIDTEEPVSTPDLQPGSEED